MHPHVDGDPQPIRGEARSVVPVTIIAGLYFASMHVVQPFIPLYVAQIGGGAVLVGLVLSSYALFPLLIVLQAGQWIDRLGPRPAMVAGTAAMIAGAAAYLASVNVWVLMLAQVLSGTGHTLLWMGAQTAASQVGSRSTRDRDLGIFTFGTGVGQLGGPLLGGWLYDTLGFGAAFLGSLIGSVLILPMVIRWAAPAREAAARHAAEASARRPFSSLALLASPGVQVALVASFVVLFISSVRQSFLPVWMEGVGLSGLQIGAVVSVAGVASLLVRPLMTNLLRVMTRKRLLMASLAAGVVAVALIPWARATWSLAAVAFMIGAGGGLNQPLTLSVVANSTSDDQRGSAMALRLLANRVALVLSPLAVGFVAGGVGLAAAFWTAAAFLGGVTGVLWQRLRSSGLDQDLALQAGPPSATP